LAIEVATRGYRGGGVDELIQRDGAGVHVCPPDKALSGVGVDRARDENQRDKEVQDQGDKSAEGMGKPASLPGRFQRFIRFFET